METKSIPIGRMRARDLIVKIWTAESSPIFSVEQTAESAMWWSYLSQLEEIVRGESESVDGELAEFHEKVAD